MLGSQLAMTLVVTISINRFFCFFCANFSHGTAAQFQFSPFIKKTYVIGLVIDSHHCTFDIPKCRAIDLHQLLVHKLFCDESHANPPYAKIRMASSPPSHNPPLPHPSAQKVVIGG